MHVLAGRGLLDFEVPVARYWPEFAQNGKSDVLVRHLLTHTAGLPAPSVKVPDEALYDWDAMVHAFERSELFWQPGTKCGYHAASFGWLNGEVLRRITGVTVGEFLRTEIAGPLNADGYIGLPDAEMACCAETIPFGGFGNFLFQAMLALGGGAKSAKSAAFTNPPRPGRAANTRRWREAQIPSSNGHASARGLARLYAPLAQGGKARDLRLLSEADTLWAGREQINQMDIVIGAKVRRSLGFMLSQPETGDPRPLSAFGHPGMGGSLGFADPEHHLALGYVMNRMVMGLDVRATELNKALYACVGIK
jgi:CubicO group peptidase (beta-lactamase class C family)